MKIVDRARVEEEGHRDASQGPGGLQVLLGTTTLGSSRNLTFLGTPDFFHQAYYPLGAIHVVANGNISFFLMALHIYISHLIAYKI